MAPILPAVGATLAGTATTAQVATTVAAVGTGMAAYGQYQQNQAAEAQIKSQENIANFNAKVAEQQAEAERQRVTGFASKRQAKKAAEIRSSLTAKLGEGLGSPVAGDLAAEQASELELENLLIGFEGEVKARRHENQAQLDILQGKLAKQKGKSAARGAKVQFGVQLAGMAAGETSFLKGFGTRTLAGNQAAIKAAGGLTKVAKTAQGFLE